MKTLLSSIVLFAFVGILMIGCSEQNQSPIAPTDQAPLQKASITNFTFTDFPIAEPTGGEITLIPGGKWQVKEIEVLEMFASSNPLVNGIMKHYLSLTIDAVTGEGPCHGSFTVTPSDPNATGGGVWEGTYEGYRSKSAVEGEWILPLKVEGHGKGGTIAGMQIKANATLIVIAGLPTTLPSSWTGTGEGFYKSHD
jgi:hypothetical protein